MVNFLKIIYILFKKIHRQNRKKQEKIKGRLNGDTKKSVEMLFNGGIKDNILFMDFFKVKKITHLKL